jgi:hypothetical protein
MHTIHEATDQNGIHLFGATISNIILPCVYTSKFKMLRRLAVVKKQLINGCYNDGIKY